MLYASGKVWLARTGKRGGGEDLVECMRLRKTEETKARSTQASISKLRKVSTAPKATNPRSPKQRPRLSGKKRESTTLLPFGNVLSEISENEKP